MKERVLAFCCLLLLFISCKQSQKDTGIKELLSSKAKTEVSFAGVNYVVKDGVVTLSGSTPTEEEKQKVEEKVRKVAGVKDVVNQIVVAPVVLDADHLLKQSVDSVLKKYPAVQAIVEDSIIILEGSIGSKKAQKLFTSLQSLKAKEVTNKMVITNEE